MGARKGSLSYKNVKAHEVKERNPVLKGRIAVERGAGVVEFPNYAQFKKIAREEKVPPELVEKAFGHMK